MRNFLAILFCFVVLPLGADELAGRTIYGYHPDKTKQLTFTFDDGPHPTRTPQLLDTLKKLNLKATFFVLGAKAKQYPEIIKRILREGHTIGNHSYDHPQLTKLTPEQLKFQMEETEKILQKITGKKPTLMRPPYGAINTQVREYLKKKKYAIIMWNVDTLDWKWKDVEKTVQYTLLNTPKKGGIILLHDIHQASIDAVPLIYKALKAKGYQFTSLQDFLKPRKKPKLPSKDEIKPLKGSGEVTANLLNSRKGPSTNFSSLTYLKKGTKVEYLGQYKGWYKVRYTRDRGPQIGWISSKFVKATADTPGFNRTLRGLNQ